jgi:uncharacterized protein
MTKRIPSINQCLDYFDSYEMLDNIRAHSFVVARVAETLIDALYRTGGTTALLPDKNEVISGALMHDIAKTLCIKTNCNHAETGKKICIDLGFPEIGEIVAEHVLLKSFNEELYARGTFGAKEMVYYSDKRVRHDEIVPLSSRLDYILERYGDGNPTKEDLIRLNFKNTQLFEKHLFTFLDFHPEELEQHIAKEPFVKSEDIIFTN